MSPSWAMSVRNTFVHFAREGENDSDSECGVQPTAIRSKTAPTLGVAAVAKLEVDGQSDDGRDTADVTESSASSSSDAAEWQASLDGMANDSSNAGSDGGVEQQARVRRTVTFASSCSEESSAADEPAFVELGLGRERRGRRAVTWHADLDGAPKDEPVFVVPLPCGNASEGRRRRRVATWHGAGAECVEEMLEQPTLERVLTRDSFESATDFLARPSWLVDSQEVVDQSPQPELSRTITRDPFELQDGSPCGGQPEEVPEDVSAGASSVTPALPCAPPCIGMVPPPCFVYPWMIDATALAQWSMMAACQQTLRPNAPTTREGEIPTIERRVGQQPAQPCGVPDARPAAKRAGDAAQRTTVMVRNLPNNYTRDDLLKLLDSQGFAGRYNFLYFPIDFDTSAALGYAFVNLLSTADAQALMHTLEGFSQWHVTSDKICTVAWSQHSQGLETHVQRYRNSPLMHELVPDSYRPVLLENGRRVAFPSPTKKIKAPRKGTRLMLL